MDTTTAKETFSLVSVLAKQEEVVFVVLHVTNTVGKIISQNVYWMHPRHDYTSLSQMKPAKVQVKLISTVKEKTDYKYTLEFTNSLDQLAFFINPQLMLNNEEIMPCFWSNNYFSLSSHESIMVTVNCPLSKLNGSQLMLMTSGWNVAKQEMMLMSK